MTRQIETRLLNEWLWEHHREDPQWTHVRLGPVPTKEMASLYKITLHWADAIVLTVRDVLIIEAKIRPNITAISQLEFYDKEFEDTPQFSAYKLWPRKKILLTTILDRKVKAFCEEKGIEYVVFHPEWVDKYWAERLKRYGR